MSSFGELDADRIRREAAAAARDGIPVRVRPDAEASLQALVDVLAAVGEAGADDAALERIE